jgi:hypothetical protein
MDCYNCDKQKTCGILKYNQTANMGCSYPNGIFYRRACEYMGIDPDNNPNYLCEKSRQSKMIEV